MKRLLSTVLGFLPLVLISAFMQTAPGGASTDSLESSPPKLPFIIKPACPGEGCSFGKWVLANPANVYELPDTSSKLIARLEANYGVEAITGEIHTSRYGEIRVTKNVELEMNEGEIKLREGDVLYQLEALGEGDSSVWFRGRIYSGFVFPDDPSIGHPDKSLGIWGKWVTERVTDWWVQIRRSTDNLHGWIINPQKTGGCYDCDEIRQFESEIADVQLLVDGRDYAEADKWLNDLEKHSNSLPPQSITEAFKRSIRELRRQVNAQLGVRQN